MLFGRGKVEEGQTTQPLTAMVDATIDLLENLSSGLYEEQERLVWMQRIEEALEGDLKILEGAMRLTVRSIIFEKNEIANGAATR